MRLSVVIVNYNTGALLEHCLASIDEKFGSVAPQVIVVDNASTDGSEQPARIRPHVTLIAGDRNIGFAAGCNAGAQAAGGEFILFLNPDTRILSDDISDLLSRFEKMPKAGALGCQNRRPDGSIQTTAYQFPTIAQLFFFVFRFGELLKAEGLKNFLAPMMKERYGQFHPHDQKRTVDWVTGAFLLVKREAWQEVGMFDQQFFLFCEEIDYCLRLKQAGFETVFDPSFEIEHKVGGSSEKVKAHVLLEKYKSYRWYFQKHRPFPENLLLEFCFAIGPRLWTIFYRLKGNKEAEKAYRFLTEGLSKE